MRPKAPIHSRVNASKMWIVYTRDKYSQSIAPHSCIKTAQGGDTKAKPALT